MARAYGIETSRKLAAVRTGDSILKSPVGAADSSGTKLTLKRPEGVCGNE